MQALNLGEQNQKDSFDRELLKLEAEYQKRKQEGSRAGSLPTSRNSSITSSLSSYRDSFEV